MARSGTGVVRLAAIPLLIWLFGDSSNHPVRSLWLQPAPPHPRRGALLPGFETETSLEEPPGEIESDRQPAKGVVITIGTACS